jgi:uncharacterized protein (DUF697 family)
MTTQAAAAAPASDSSDTTQAADTNATRLDKAHAIVKRNVYWAVGAGLVPIPGADFVAMTAVQVKMLKQLSDLYNQKFFDDKAKKIIGSLVTGTGSLAVTSFVASSLLKVIPIVGQVVGVVGVPALSGALTQAVGNLFVMHYESGGTLLDFDVEKMRDYFQKEFASAKDSVKQTPADKKTAKQPITP